MTALADQTVAVQERYAYTPTAICIFLPQMAKPLGQRRSSVTHTFIQGKDSTKKQDFTACGPATMVSSG